MPSNARNLERQTSNASLEFARGISIITPQDDLNTDCDICETRKLCEQKMQAQSQTIVPGSILCATTQGQ
jgi:hypothetical protein